MNFKRCLYICNHSHTFIMYVSINRNEVLVLSSWNSCSYKPGKIIALNHEYFKDHPQHGWEIIDV